MSPPESGASARAVAPVAAPRDPRARAREQLHHDLEHARHLLPQQAPIRAFVHHNTLHVFEDLPFEEAVVRGAEVLGGEPYESEAAFAAHLARGRITEADVRAVLAEERVSEDAVIPGGPSHLELHALRLLHPFERVEGPALAWLLTEGRALLELHEAAAEEARARVLDSACDALGIDARPEDALVALYDALLPHAPRRAAAAIGPRPRDRVLASHGVDVDELVHPLLQRVCAAFVDQGIAYWSMPGRERGLLEAFRALYGLSLGPPSPWMRGLAASLAATRGLDAEDAALAALEALGVPPARAGAVIEATLLSLRGWAGMIAQLEERPDRAPVHPPPVRLAEYLALALLLEAEAVRYVTEEHPPLRPAERPASVEDRETIYEAFVVAQLAGIGPYELAEPEHAAAWVRAVAALDGLERRRLYHLAYERHHRQHVLDSLLAHEALGVPARASTRCQAFFCIDDRSESIRRHLEELDPTIETLGYAGFFGVPMAYRGLADKRPMPLCPVVIRPTHLVTEEPLDAARADRHAARRRALGTVRHGSRVGSHTFVRGGLLSATLGLASTIPLVGRVLFPRLFARAADAVERATMEGPPTRLRVERAEGEGPTQDGLRPGFTVEEMADVVGGVLGAVGVADRLAPLVLIVGHGSSSLNNPHEAAYDCGATGGGRGGPNARAFAVMANHPGVRAELARRGAPIPEGVWFVGAAHNTSSDAIHLYDEDLVPDTHEPELARVREVFERARRENAHERCRRFMSAPLGMSAERALAHVEARSVDLAQPRAECGHATNAICLVGRRERSRGLFLDRRAFLVSYDPTRDPDGAALGPLLASVAPVSAGINLEYYFSFVDPEGYGCGSKLPHNVVGLLGVMNGHASDLRTGLPWQMVEIHEPVRLLTIVDAEPEVLGRLLALHPSVGQVARNRWIQLVAWSPGTGAMWRFDGAGFVPHVPEHAEPLSVVVRSREHYERARGHLGCARVEAALREAP